MLCLKNLRDALFLVLLIAGMVGCSSSNDASPQASEDKSRNVHTFSWLNPGSENFHGVSATSQSPQTCGSCHGLELQGSGNIPGCDNCHFDLKNFNNYSPDGSWTHGTSPHGQFIDQAATCNNCHTTLRQFEGQGPEACHDCHIHPTDGSYLGVAHRRDAKGSAENPEGLAGCQLCHGESGGEGSNASFIYGIQSAGNRGCEGCHNAGSAHPTSFSVFGALETIRWYDAVAGDPASNASSNEGATPQRYRRFPSRKGCLLYLPRPGSRRFHADWPRLFILSSNRSSLNPQRSVPQLPRQSAQRQSSPGT